MACGPASVIMPQWSAAEHINLGNALLMPGLINAHTHAAMSILRGYADDLPLLEWLNDHIFPLEQRLTPDIVEWGTLLGCAEMIRTGTTSFNDMYLLEDAALRAADRSGLRCLGGEVLFGFASAAYADTAAAFDLVRAQCARWKAHPRIDVAVAPHAVYTTSPQLLEQCARLADELHAPILMHAAESPAETAQSQQMFGKRPLALCRESRLLGPRTTLDHCVDITDEEIGWLAESGTCVAHNPRSNMKLASGAARFDDMLKAGVSVAIGTDGAASNNQLNMFADMSACALLHKLHRLDPTAAPARAVLDAATVGGAHAMGVPPLQPGETKSGTQHPWQGLGTLAPGAPADCIALDLDAPNLQPVYNAVSQVVYAASGHEVCFSMVEGRTLYREGRFLSFDYKGLCEEIRKLRAWSEKR